VETPIEQQRGAARHDDAREAMLAERDLRHLYLNDHLSDAFLYTASERFPAHTEVLNRCVFMAKRLKVDPFLRWIELSGTSPMTARLVLALLYRVPLPGFISAETAEAFARETAAYAPELLELPDAEIIRDALSSLSLACSPPSLLVPRSRALSIAGVEPTIAKSDSPDRALLWLLELEPDSISAS
jgi:hypothetical protein